MTQFICTVHVPPPENDLILLLTYVFIRVLFLGFSSVMTKNVYHGI